MLLNASYGAVAKASSISIAGLCHGLVIAGRQAHVVLAVLIVGAFEAVAQSHHLDNVVALGDEIGNRRKVCSGPKLYRAALIEGLPEVSRSAPSRDGVFGCALRRRRIRIARRE